MLRISSLFLYLCDSIVWRHRLMLCVSWRDDDKAFITLSYSELVQGKMPWRRGLSFTSQHHQMRMRDGLSEDQASLGLSSSYTSTHQASTAGPLSCSLCQDNSVSSSSKVLGWWPSSGLSAVHPGAWLILTTHLTVSFLCPRCLHNSLTNISARLCPSTPAPVTFVRHPSHPP